MELFRPDVRGDLLYFDLDTVIHGDLSDIASVFRLTALRDFYRPDGLGSGMMFIPMHARATIWAAWTAKPDRWMGEYRSGGDQAFLEQFWLYEALRWQDIVPGQVVSFKANSEAERSRSRVTCYHGKPKPHETGWTP